MNKLDNIKIVLLMFTLIITLTPINAQNVANRNEKGTTVHDLYLDSISKIPYPYRFPILGEKIRKMGFDIPLPNGIMALYTVGKQNITVSNLKIGTKDWDPENLIDVSKIAYFSSLEATVEVANARYDFWLLPFLNFSILGGYVKSETMVNLALPFKATFPAYSNGPLVGWGVTAAGGFGQIFITADYQMAWTFMPALEKPSNTKLFDIRVGHTFTFNNKRDMNLSAMIGAQYLKLSSRSKGSVSIEKLLGLPDDAKKDAAEQLEDWYNGLPPAEQELFADIYNKLDGWLNDGKDDNLYYDFNKKMYYPWAMTAGLNWQINKRWMVTGVYTFLGSREQLTLGLNYRFGFKGKTLLSGIEF